MSDVKREVCSSTLWNANIVTLILTVPNKWKADQKVEGPSNTCLLWYILHVFHKNPISYLVGFVGSLDYSTVLCCRGSYLGSLYNGRVYIDHVNEWKVFSISSFML